MGGRGLATISSPQPVAPGDVALLSPSLLA